MHFHGDMAGAFRLRLGDYRVLFTLQDDAVQILSVRHRSEAFR
jgi:mRNA-degrading endonuclease RelE of RelBE toxin-antitoxin system